MAGTTALVLTEWSRRPSATAGTDVESFGQVLFREFNRVITDLETLRVGLRGFCVQYEHEQLAADADIAARPIFENRVASTVVNCRYIPRGNSAGIDGSNTLVVTLRNITEGVDVATITRTTNLTGGTPIDVPVTGANADIALGDVLGLTITQGTAADVDIGILQFELKPQTVDAAADLVASSINDLQD